MARKEGRGGVWIFETLFGGKQTFENYGNPSCWLFAGCEGFKGRLLLRVKLAVDRTGMGEYHPSIVQEQRGIEGSLNRHGSHAAISLTRPLPLHHQNSSSSQAEHLGCPTLRIRTLAHFLRLASRDKNPPGHTNNTSLRDDEHTVRLHGEMHERRLWTLVAYCSGGLSYGGVEQGGRVSTTTNMFFVDMSITTILYLATTETISKSTGIPIPFPHS